MLGNGSYLTTFCVILVLALLSTASGAMFGTVYRAFGPGRTVVVAVGVGLALFAALALAVWQRGTEFPWLTTLGVWAAVVVGAALAACAALGSYAANRLATV